ncbi:Gfo/Idh/MocA family protein [Planctomonas psychrotolerans]|uniref:Gfo/Idh/MocA family protein n=1 Tax=Planctomonas psychrotolerans TaxID=2528712 RepID=UPI00123BBD6B|nr:Gfo/Idh/MocA family oxidoreductase [Planctomonas psychrotolerans]
MDEDRNTQPLRVALVGTGAIAGIHAADLRAVAGMELVAATDIDPLRLRDFAAQWDVARTFPDLESLLGELGSPDALDIVHLCSPPGLHREQALSILGRGISVLSEKPPTLSLTSLDDIRAAERPGGPYFATVSQHRFGGRAVWLREIVRSGAFGRLLTGVCNTFWYRPDAYYDVPWRGEWANEGGGPTLGLGIHQVDTLLSLVGPWDEVVAVAARRARTVQAEDVSHAIVTLSGGALISVVNSVLSPRETSALRLDFEHATVELDHLYGYTDADWRVTPAPGSEDLVRAALVDGPHGVPSGHAAQFAAMVAAVRSGGPLPVDSSSARSTLELIAATYASAFTGARVRAGDIDERSPFYSSMEGSGAPWPHEAPAPPL